MAGTLLVVPYTGVSLASSLFVDARSMRYVPFFLLPVVWGAWNAVRARARRRMAIGAWGALLGVVLAAGVNLLLRAEGGWFEAALLLPVVLPAVYYLLWYFIVGPLNDALGVEG